MKYDNYIFDLYGTLADIHTDEESMELWQRLSVFYALYGAKYTPKELKAEYKRLVSEEEKKLQSSLSPEMDAAGIHPEIKLERVFSLLFEQKGINAENALAIHAGQFFRVLSLRRLRLFKEAKDVLRTLRQAGAKVYLLSNAQRIFTWYELNMLGIAEDFDDIFLSSDFGMKKPDIRFYKALIDKHRIVPSRSVMIGNDMQCDIVGAKNVGLSACYICPKKIAGTEKLSAADCIFPEVNSAILKEIL